MIRFGTRVSRRSWVTMPGWLALYVGLIVLSVDFYIWFVKMSIKASILCAKMAVRVWKSACSRAHAHAAAGR